MNDWVTFWGNAPPVTQQKEHTVFEGEQDISAAHGALDNDLKS